jgi:hypothetical protein
VILSFHVVGDRRQRLVDLMGERGGHLAHGRQSRHVGEFSLQFLQPLVGLLAFCEVADESAEEAPFPYVHLADGLSHCCRDQEVVAPFAVGPLCPPG